MIYIWEVIMPRRAVKKTTTKKTKPSRGIYVALKKRGRKPKETNKFIIDLINGAKRIFSPE